MSPVMNWADKRKEAEEGSKEFTPLEENRYNFIVKDQPKASDNNGLPVYSIRATVEDGPRKNASIFHYFNYSESAWATKNFFFDPLAVLGLDGAFFDTNPNDDQIIKGLMGKRFSAEVFIDTYGGKEKRKLRNFAPATGPAPQGNAPGPATPPVAAQAAPVAPPAPAQEQTPAPAAQEPPAPAQTASPWGNSAPPPPPGL